MFSEGVASKAALSAHWISFGRLNRLKKKNQSMTRIRSRFRGLSSHRYKDNPLERTFAKLWERINTLPSGPAALDYLMDLLNRGTPDPSISDRDWLVASTVIQWLGSPVGQNFLFEALSNKSAKDLRTRLAAAMKETP